MLGLGRSGVAAAKLLAAHGAEVYASDVADAPKLRAAADAVRRGGGVAEVGRHDLARLRACDVVVVSPGIPPSAPVLQAPELKGKPILSEVELAFRFLRAPVIAVTGTNGKTTTAAWIGHCLATAGLRAAVGGNIGYALSEIALAGAALDWIVVEVSSYQLAHIARFKPGVGVLLNLAPDHLDRYVRLEAYYADKARLFENAGAESRWVLNGEDDAVQEMARGRAGSVRVFCVRRPLAAAEEGGWLRRDGVLLLRVEEEEIPLCARGELRLLGLHNVANGLAAAVAAVWAGAAPQAVAEGLGSFAPLPHRLEPVAERGGVLFINDSKATNVASTRVALEAMTRPVVLLLGGRHKGEPYTRLLQAMQGRVRAVVAYGEAGEIIERELARGVPVRRVTGPFDEVVAAARGLAKPGDAVLLSPACASFDMFTDFEERGARFGALAGGGSA